MGKHLEENDHDQQQQNLDPENPQPSGFTCRSCSSALSRLFGLGCVIVLVLSFATLLSAIFWLFPRRSLSQFDGDGIVQLNASVQAYFRLHEPASEVISHRGELEKDIFRSIDLGNTKVAILSLHHSGPSNYTAVKFAVLPVPTDSTIRKDSLSSLQSSFVNLFAQRSNLNLTSSSFGQPTSFQVLKFPGGITLDPLGFKPVSSRVLDILFSFKLEISLSEIQDNLPKLKNQLEVGLCLEPNESVHVLLSNEEGTTISPPVTIKASVVSTMPIMENLSQQRLDNLSQVIQTSRAKNLGLDNTVFGQVKSITYSTYLDGNTLESASVLAPAPTSCFPSLC